MLRVDVATGGQPLKAVTIALSALAPEQISDVELAHDDGCPCLLGEALAECSCEIIHVCVLEVA